MAHKSILDLYEDKKKDLEIKDFSIAPGISKSSPTSDDQKTPISVGLGNGPRDKELEAKIKVGTNKSISVEEARGILGSHGTMAGKVTSWTPEKRYGRDSLGRGDKY